MRYGTVLTACGAAFLFLGLQSGPVSWLLIWASVSFVAVGSGYLLWGPRVFGKRDDGVLPFWAVCLLFPYLLLTEGLWHIQRWLSREAVCNEVAPGLWLGRRPLDGELPGGVGMVVDLTAEFPAARTIRALPGYRCLPTLDASVPDAAALQALIGTIVNWRQGGVYIHCASGHGRSAMVTMAVLLAKGLAVDISDAEAKVRAARPQIGLRPCQRRFLERADWLKAAAV